MPHPISAPPLEIEPPEDYEEFPEDAPAWVSLMAGAVAGIAEHTITFPFDSIKVQVFLVFHCIYAIAA